MPYTPYRAHDWEISEAITRGKMNNIEQGIKNVENLSMSNTSNITTMNSTLDTLNNTVVSIQDYLRSNGIDQISATIAAMRTELENSHTSKIKIDATVADSANIIYASLSKHLDDIDDIVNEVKKARGNDTLLSKFLSLGVTAESALQKATTAYDNIEQTILNTTYTTLNGRLNGMDSKFNTIESNIQTTNTSVIPDAIRTAIGFDTNNSYQVKTYIDNVIGNIETAGNVVNYITNLVTNTTAELNLNEINDAHREGISGDTLANRFSNAEAQITAILNNINGATLQNTHSFADLDERFDYIDSILSSLSNVTSTTVISVSDFTDLQSEDGDPNLNYIVGPDNNGKYYYYKWINDNALNKWKLISGGAGGGGTGTSSAQVVDTLPSENIDVNTDYYLSINNGYRHYRYINNDWVLITPEVIADVNDKLINYNTRIGALETSVLQNNNRVTSITAHTGKNYTLNYYIDNNENAPQEVTLKAPITITDIELSEDQTKLTITDSEGDFKEINLPQGGGGSASSGILTVNRIGANGLQVLADTPCNLSFTITAAEASGDVLTGAATAQWYVNGELKETVTASADFKAGMEQTEANRVVNTFNIAKYLSAGVNSVRLRVSKNTGGDTDNASSISWTINMVQFYLTWNYDESTIQDGSKIQFRWTPYGTGIEKTTHIYIDKDTEAEKHFTSVTSTNGLIQTLEIDNDLSHGSHLVEMYMTGTINERQETSQSVHHSLIVVVPGISTPIISTSKTSITMTQYDTEAIPLVVYDPTKLETNATLYVDDVLVDTWSNIDRTTHYWYYTPNLEGAHSLRITSGTASLLITVIVEELELEDVQEIGGYDLKLKASDFTSNAALQTYTIDGSNNIAKQLIFSENFDWTNGGLKTEFDENNNIRQYICIKAGSTITIPYQLFASDIKSTGADVKIIFKAVNCSNYDTTIVNCMTSQEVYNNETQQNETQYTGFRMNAHDALLGGTSKSITTQYGENEYTELEFEIYQKNANVADYMMLWVDGVMSSARAYTDAENFVQNTPQNIVIGSQTCDVYIYLIKIYKTSLDRDSHLANFIADAPNATEIALRYNRNDILDDMNEINPEKLADKNPNCRVWKYDIPRMTHSKDDQVSGCGFEQIYKGGTEDDQLRGIGTISVQGTSSVNYRYGAANTDINFEGGKLYTVTRSGGTPTNVKDLLQEETPGLKLSADALPITYANMKVNFASCEQVNNMCNAEWYDRFQPYPSLSARDCMEFHMGVQFIRDAHATGEQINLFSEKTNYDPSKFYMYSIGNLGNSKKNTHVFHSNKECCIEIKENTSDAQRMKVYDSEWTQEGHDSNYEMRYPKLNKTSQAMRDGWERFVTWMVANNPNAASGDALAEPVTFDAYTFKGHNRPIINKTGHHYEQVLQGLVIDRFAGTYTHDTFNYRMAKMLSECEDYMAMDSIVYHFCFIERHTMVDNVAKNTFWSSNETNHYVNGEEIDDTPGYWIWDLSKNYDNDTSDGNNNNGLLVFDYGNEATDTYRNGTTAVFNGNDSVWFVFVSNLYEACQRMFINRETYGAWNSQMYHAYLTSEQRKVPERVWNECYWYDYLRTYESNDSNMQTTWINFLDGGQKIHQRSHFETYQEIYMSSKYLSPFSRNQSITIRGEAVENENLPSAKTEFVITMFNKCYLTIHIGTNEKTVKCQKNVPVTITFYKDETHPELGYMSLSNSVIDIDSGSMIQAIGDLSLLYPSSCQFGAATRLRSLTIGSDIEGYYNPNMTSTSEITLNNPILETLIIQNLRNANYTLDLSRCPELAIINAKGSGFTGYVFANGGKLTNAVIEKPTALVLKNLNLLSNTNLTIRDYSRLTNLQIENCKLLDELTILNAATALDTVRLVGLDWYNSVEHLYELTSKDILDRLLLLKGIDHNGYVLPQSYLSGRIDLNPENKILRQYIMAYREAWEPNLILNINSEDILQQNKVSFYDEDGITKLSQYDYYLAPGEYLYDPIIGRAGSDQQEARPPKNPPTKAMNEANIYTFGELDNNGNYREFSGWYTFNNVQMTAGYITNDTSFKAVYSSSPRKYTVRWFGYNNVLLDTQEINYGTEAVTSVIPSSDYNIETHSARTFKGWDKSSGYITQNLDINAVFNIGTLPDRTNLVASGINSLNPAQIYALGRTDDSTRTDLLAMNVSDNVSMIKDELEITMGNDYNFSNVISNQLIENEATFKSNSLNLIKTFNGTNQLPNLQLLHDDEPFTLVIDYKFNCQYSNNYAGQTDWTTPSYDRMINNTLVSCYENINETEVGFRLFIDRDNNDSTYKTRVSWGSRENAVFVGGGANNKFYRDIIVLRKPRNSKNLYVYYTTPSELYGNNVTSIILQKDTDSYTDAPLIFGGCRRWNTDYQAFEFYNTANGLIYWSKIWHEDLGDTICTSLAQWCHEKVQFELEGFKDTNNNYQIIKERSSTGESVGLTFIAKSLLGDKLYQIAGTTKIPSNGWREHELKVYCNNRIYNGIPMEYRTIIKLAPIYSYGKIQDPTQTNRVQGTYTISGVRYSTPIDDYITIPSRREVDGINVRPHEDEANGIIPWFASPGINTCYVYNSGNIEIGQMTENYNRIKFRNRAITNNTKFFIFPSNPYTNPSYPVLPGDIWIRTSNNVQRAYMYISEEEIEKYDLQIETGETFDCKSNNIRIGGWIAADYWWTRSLAYSPLPDFFFTVSGAGATGGNPATSPYVLDCGICPQFSV